MTSVRPVAAGGPRAHRRAVGAGAREQGTGASCHAARPARAPARTDADSERAVTESRPATYWLSIATAGTTARSASCRCASWTPGPWCRRPPSSSTSSTSPRSTVARGVGRALLAEAVASRARSAPTTCRCTCLPACGTPTGSTPTGASRRGPSGEAHPSRRCAARSARGARHAARERGRPAPIQRLLRRRAVLGSRLARPARLPREGSRRSAGGGGRVAQQAGEACGADPPARRRR